MDTFNPVSSFNQFSYEVKARQIDMKEKFKKQIGDIAEHLPNWVLCGRHIHIPIQQQEKITRLINLLQEQLKQLN